MRVVLLAVMLSACAPAQHLYVVEPVKLPATVKEREVGNWFVRKVYQPDAGKKKLYAVEILYCPTEKPVFSECRMAVAWSRSGSGGLGPQVDAPPSPTRSSPPAEMALPAKESEAAEAPTSTVPKGVETKGRDLLELTASDVASLREWVKRPVIVTLTSGKTVHGALGTVDTNGLTLDRSGKLASYRWEEIAGVALAGGG
jgi:hypothetical protein